MGKVVYTPVREGNMIKVKKCIVVEVKLTEIGCDLYSTVVCADLDTGEIYKRRPCDVFKRSEDVTLVY